MSNKYWLSQVLLEKGFEFEGETVLATKTEQAHLLIEDGRIIEIRSALNAAEGIPVVNAGGALALPSFTEKHIHLDKGHFGGPWRACTPFTSVFDRIEEEEGFLRDFLPQTTERAEALLDLVTGFGVTHARVQCNVDPVIGLANVERVMKALDNYENRLSYEMVAFPQHGLLGSVPFMKDALRNGVKVVGGLDPATIDNNVEASLSAMMDMAVEFDVDVDIHLHDGGSLGIYTIKRLTEMVEEAKWQGRVNISHAYCLGGVSEAVVRDIGQRLAAQDISIATTSPIDAPAPPVPLLDELGVSVSIINDNINDHWSPFGTGDLLQRASRMAEKFGCIDEYSLSRALKFITDGRPPLDDKGDRQWPMVGDPANMVLLDVSCSAEAVARIPERKAVLFKGRIVSGKL